MTDRSIAHFNFSMTAEDHQAIQVWLRLVAAKHPELVTEEWERLMDLLYLAKWMPSTPPADQ